MKVTKFLQSCLLLDNGQARILIDPGTLVLDRFVLDDLLPFDAVLFTHRHADHYDERVVAAARERGCRLVGNADVCELLGEGDGVTVTANGVPMDVVGFEVTPYDVPHMAMVDGSPPPPNTGFLIDGDFIHPGDGLSFPVAADSLAVPIAGPDASFRDAYLFVEQVGAKRVIPIHHDVFVAKPEMFAARCDIAEVIVLEPGQSTEL